MRAFEKMSESSLERLFTIALILETICFAVLLIDISGEVLILYLTEESRDLGDEFHVIIESLATTGLAYAIIRKFIYLRRLKSKYMSDEQLLHALRTTFDQMLRSRFAEWGLSEAEKDVALLSIRGLKIAEIAEMRNTRSGTVKAQLSGIFRKSGVSTRAELLAMFIDDFLDFDVPDFAVQKATPSVNRG